MRRGRRVAHSRSRSEGGAWQARTARPRDRTTRHRGGWVALVAVSAVVGLPPFAIVSVLAGTLPMRLPTFVAIGSAGRWLRFGLIVLAPGAAAWLPHGGG